LRAARGEFIAFLDSDDVQEIRMLETHLAAISARPEVAMVYRPSRWWYPDNPRADWIERMDRQVGRTFQPPAAAALRAELPLRRLAALRSDFDFTKNQTLWAKLLPRFPVHVLSYCGARYRQHQASTSARTIADGHYNPWRPHPAQASFLEWVKAHVTEAGVRDQRISMAIRIAQVPYVGGRGLTDHLFWAAWKGLSVTNKVRKRLKMI
jgi:hypothetical protein